jgi:hypothetical protein
MGFYFAAFLVRTLNDVDKQLAVESVTKSILFTIKLVKIQYMRFVLLLKVQA